ncbi:UNVERIFIED_ORG: hypothetical protein FNL38_1011030 [Nocardia globerula]|uniref:Uncharacterized protein n=1 Tax=Nocardia globerula TaxID=1818 RepID=A0A652YY78_NOCGL|nr:hypothetical protein [Rhodococcus globerulus]NMD58971.1 hypothetical protein [Nocardia globerula]PVX64964.1 hypothetical protein C8E04_2250 [Rhodococcus globerulus]
MPDESTSAELPTQSPVSDQARAATLLLACLDNDEDATIRILDGANRAPGGLQGLLAALAAAVIELLVGTVGEDGARKTLNMTLLDASLNGDLTHDQQA